MRRILVFEYRCFLSIGRIWFENVMSNSDVGLRVRGIRVQIVKRSLDQSRLR